MNSKQFPITENKGQPMTDCPLKLYYDCNLK